MLSYEQGVTKPDPEIFKRAMDALGVSADECLYVGDGGSKELFAARDVGMKTVQARYFADLAYEPHVPCAELDGFDHAYTQSDILKYV
jgi:putative hydrolase of the HAD superfamily